MAKDCVGAFGCSTTLLHLLEHIVLAVAYPHVSTMVHLQWPERHHERPSERPPERPSESDTTNTQEERHNRKVSNYPCYVVRSAHFTLCSTIQPYQITPPLSLLDPMCSHQPRQRESERSGERRHYQNERKDNSPKARKINLNSDPQERVIKQSLCR